MDWGFVTNHREAVLAAWRWLNLAPHLGFLGAMQIYLGLLQPQFRCDLRNGTARHRLRNINVAGRRGDYLQRHFSQYTLSQRDKGDVETP